MSIEDLQILPVMLALPFRGEEVTDSLFDQG
jgi:hypothetical protein